MIIDFHTHTFPEHVAERAIATLESSGHLKAFADGRLESLTEELSSGPVTHALSLPVATKPEQVEVINNYYAKMEHDRVFFGGAMHPHYKEFEPMLNFLKKNGFKGIKMHPEFQNFNPADRAYYPLYETLSTLDMFILFHSGFDDMIRNRDIVSKPSRYARIAGDFPNLKMIAAHMGGHCVTAEAEESIIGREIYIDLSFELSMLPAERAEKIINKHPKEYILYASDWPWQPIQGYFKLFDRLKISDDKKELILKDNALRLLEG